MLPPFLPSIKALKLLLRSLYGMKRGLIGSAGKGSKTAPTFRLTPGPALLTPRLRPSRTCVRAGLQTPPAAGPQVSRWGPRVETLDQAGGKVGRPRDNPLTGPDPEAPSARAPPAAATQSPACCTRPGTETPSAAPSTSAPPATPPAPATASSATAHGWSCLADGILRSAGTRPITHGPDDEETVKIGFVFTQ